MNSLIVGPHPDDELLGCGGTLLKRVAQGGTVGWILMTAMSIEKGWNKQQVETRDVEIEQVRQGLGISVDHLFKLNLPATELDQFSKSSLITSMAEVFKKFEPNEIFLPHPGDIHSDHRITFDIASACTKWFRFPSIKRVMTYETLSETDFGFDQVTSSFNPNLFVDITDYLDKKIDLLSLYKSEVKAHPFPRSLAAVRAQAVLRGAQRGVNAAEAFALLRLFE